MGVFYSRTVGVFYSLNVFYILLAKVEKTKGKTKKAKPDLRNDNECEPSSGRSSTKINSRAMSWSLLKMQYKNCLFLVEKLNFNLIMVLFQLLVVVSSQIARCYRA